MDDKRLEMVMGNLLRAGVLLAASIVLAGGVAYLVQHGSARVDYHHFSAAPENAQTFSGIVRSAAGLHSEGWIQVGLLLLIATPVARVVLALVGFALERDRLYTCVSLIVLLVLVFSLMRAT